ncbi:hypothetical protein RSAG8_04800, partial [Rhizoctonia solani AG-8 WAC10335]
MSGQSGISGVVGNNGTGQSQSSVPAGPSQAVSAFVYNSGFGPSNGGDTLVRCGDNVRFLFRSTALRTFFPWFIGNIPPNPTCPIEFPYSSSVLNLMVRFVSNQTLEPNRDTCTWGYIVDCFQAACRYRLYSLLAWLRSQLVLPTSIFYLGQNPIGAYRLCSLGQFQVEKQQAFQSCIGKLDFRDKSTMDTVIKECPDTKIALELICRLTRRSAIITQLFSGLHAYPMDMRSNYWTLGPLGRDAPQYCDLTCPTCQDMAIFATPVWLSFWAYRAKNELLKNPGDQCDHIFRVEYLGRRVPYLQVFGGEQEDHEVEASRFHDGAISCERCLTLIMMEQSSAWEEWASRVRGYLRFELGGDF